MLLLIDNYDSFTFNLAQYFMQLGEDVHVTRNDIATPAYVRALKPARICISPGPSTPERAGQTLAVIASFAGKIPLLGVCLGHQAIARHFGARITHAPQPMHGKVSRLTHQGGGLFAGLPSPMVVCRYHSLAILPRTLPAKLMVTAESDDGVIMGVAHREWPLWGVQFHPEAILTEHGHALLGNFLKMSA